jgi:hypothetical protein
MNEYIERGTLLELETFGEYRMNVWNYCPVCGARMDGGADNG